MQPIPEDLYNLTQLAEVTLAAGRLPITEYMNKGKTTKESSSNDVEKINGSLIIDRRKIKIRKKFTSKDEIDALSSLSSDTSYHHSVFINDNEMKNNSGYNRKKDNRNIISCSSSDDNLNYYSHKIFDRQKSRRSTISMTNSRNDEYSSSSSTPLSSDENVLNRILRVSNPSNGQISPDDDHTCPECGKKYSTSSNLARHRQTHRSILDKKARQCPHCEKVYVSMPAYSMHVRTHSQGCECPHCGKCFSRPWLLQGHIRTHTGEKPFKCSICEKAFADKSNLRAHIQTHSNTKPHSCERCGKSFALKSYLYKHEESSCMRNNVKNNKDRIKSPSSKFVKNDNTSMESEKKSNQEYEGTTTETGKTYTNLVSSTLKIQSNLNDLTKITILQSTEGNQEFKMIPYENKVGNFSSGTDFSQSNKTGSFELTNKYTLVA